MEEKNIAALLYNLPAPRRIPLVHYTNIQAEMYRANFLIELLL
jgi:hypothetical protein